VATEVVRTPAIDFEHQPVLPTLIQRLRSNPLSPTHITKRDVNTLDLDVGSLALEAPCGLRWGSWLYGFFVDFGGGLGSRSSSWASVGCRFWKFLVDFGGVLARWGCLFKLAV
jgi:hypothetical protein